MVGSCSYLRLLPILLSTCTAKNCLGHWEEFNSTSTHIFDCPILERQPHCSAIRTLRIFHRRRFVFTSNCQTFNPDAALSFFKNKKLVLIGDSILTQVWESLVCEFYESYKNVKFILEPDKGYKGGYKIGTKSAIFLDYNFTIINSRFDWYYKARSALAFLKPYCDSGADVVLNFGIHYNEYLGKPPQQPDRDDYLSALWELSNDIKSIGDACKWRLWFAESTPQHFEGDNYNGYFNAKRGKKCREENTSLDGDWRNALLRNRSVSRLPDSLQLISFPELYSQWDAHLELDIHTNDRNTSIDFADCTHWCNPSGALQYMQMVILNNLLATRS